MNVYWNANDLVSERLQSWPLALKLAICVDMLRKSRRVGVKQLDILLRISCAYELSTRGRDNAVGIATRYRLDGPCF